LGGFGNAFVTKLNPPGSALVYSTYLGGTNFDEGLGIAVDAGGHAHVTGVALSPDFPTQEAFQTSFGGGFDAFVTKLDPTGTALVYSSFLGGSGFDVGFGIAVDSLGQTYVTGFTTSSNFPTTPGAFQTTFGGGSFDAFVAKILEFNTAVGTNVSVRPVDAATGTEPVTLTFSSVFQAGATTLTTSAAGPPPPTGCKLGNP